jgi:hypothetical protein
LISNTFKISVISAEQVTKIRVSYNRFEISRQPFFFFFFKIVPLFFFFVFHIFSLTIYDFYALISNFLFHLLFFLIWIIIYRWNPITIIYITLCRCIKCLHQQVHEDRGKKIMHIFARNVLFLCRILHECYCTFLFIHLFLFGSLNVVSACIVVVAVINYECTI